MSRAAVFDALSGDTALNALGISEDTIFPNFSSDTRPVGNGAFLILRWEESTLYSQTYTGMQNGLNRAPRVLTVWAHIPIEVSTDFVRIDQILDSVDEVLLPMEHVEGSDGMTVTCIRPSGKSADQKDEGYNTITRNAAYGVLSRPTLL